MQLFTLATLLLPSLLTFTHASPVRNEERAALSERLYNGCIDGYKADETGLCHRILDYNCNIGRCYGPIPPRSHPICSVDGKCGFECNAGNGFNGTSCNPGRKPCSVTDCDAHTPPFAKTTCFNDRCYFMCYPGYHRVADTCQKTVYACSNNSPALCPELRPDFSTTLCINNLCSVACNNGYQYSANGNHCVPNITKCGKGATATTCSAIANGGVTCDSNNACVYSCNAEAGYSLSGPQTCTKDPCK